MLELIYCTALECIGQGGLGYSFDTFSDNNTNQYSQAVKDLLSDYFHLLMCKLTD